MPTGYFLRLAGLFTQSPGNLGHRGHTCTVSETELELHTNQPQRPTPEYDPESPAGLAWLQRAWHCTQLSSSCPARQGCMCVCLQLCNVVVMGGASWLPPPHPFFLILFFGAYLGNWLSGSTVGTHRGSFPSGEEMPSIWNCIIMGREILTGLISRIEIQSERIVQRYTVCALHFKDVPLTDPRVQLPWASCAEKLQGSAQEKCK